MDLNKLRHAGWTGGQLLAFSGLDGPTDYDNGLTARTAFESCGIDVKLPGNCKLRFPGQTVDSVLVAGDFFEVQPKTGSGVRGAFLDAHHLLVEGPCEVLERDDTIACVSKGGRVLVGAAACFKEGMIAADLDAALAERSNWLHQQNLSSTGSPSSQRALLKALSLMKTQVFTPEGNIRHRWTTPDRWPHRGMWLWDSVFHAIGWRHVDVGLAREMLSAVFDAQREDGFVPHCITPSTGSSITQPPILALGVKLVSEVAPDEAWIETLYPKLCAYVAWDLAHRDTDGGGLVEWFIEGDPLCRSGESGMDNSPRFDSATQLDAVDFNAFLASECEVLADFAVLLGLHEDAMKWKAHHERLCRLINERLWSDENRFYMDYDVDREAFSPVLASSGFLPLICGAASPEQASQLAGHLRDPELFGTALPVPSVAAKDVGHYAKDMWRGPVWVNLNWLIAYGFERTGLRDVADELRNKTMREIEKMHEQYGTFFEFYDDQQVVDPPRLLRKGKCAPEEHPYHQVFHDYGWTATLYVDMVCSQG